MRIKSVPRHLPRRNLLQARLMSNNKINAEYTLAFERVIQAADAGPVGNGGGAANVRIVNFTNYEDILRNVELVVHQQKNSTTSQKCELPKSPPPPPQTPVDDANERVHHDAVDLSVHNQPCSSSSSIKRNSTLRTPPPLMSLEPREFSHRGLDAMLTINDNNNNNSISTSNENLKDTYLYQIMTNPDLLDKIIREKHQTYATLTSPSLPSFSLPPTTIPSVSPSTHINPNPNPNPIITSKTKTASCPYCKREFSNEAEVKRHLNMQSRNDSNQLLCCACGKSFAQKRYLRYHQRCHSERNKYACDICTRKYSRQDNLTRHNIFHTNPDKFPCNSCERTFARKDLLNKHLKCHENKWKYYCEECKKYFKGPVSLDNHMRLLHSANGGGNRGGGGGSRRGSSTRGRAVGLRRGKEDSLSRSSSSASSSCDSSRSGEKLRDAES